MKTDMDDILDTLRTFAHRNDPNRVIEAEQALQSFGTDAVHVLKAALEAGDTDLRLLALQILEHFAGATEPALPAMIKALDDPNRIVRIAAIGPVAAFREKAMGAVPILEKWIGSDDEFSHVTAIGHILMIDPSKAGKLLPALVRFLDSDDYGVRCQAAWLLRQHWGIESGADQLPQRS